VTSLASDTHRAPQGQHIFILSGNHLCHNPRVIKEATSLAEAGHEVTVLGAWIDPTLKMQDELLAGSIPFSFTPVKDITAGISRDLVPRTRSRLGAIACEFGGFENRWQLGYTYPHLRRAAFRCRGNLYIAHSEPGLAVAADLHRRGRRVAVDMEDWFSEDLLPEARRNRPLRLLRRLEGELLTEGGFASCPSQAMSRALAQEFGCRPPAVIYNAFAWAERRLLDGLYKDRAERGRASIHWFSQTIGPGRGLEDLLAALPQVTHAAEIHLRGNPVAGFAAWLAERTPEAWRGRILVHGLVPNQELLSRIAEHDIGFAGEMKYCRSRDLTVTNKFLQYLLAGLAAVVSDTAGQQEVAEQAGDAVLLYPSGDAAALAAQLNALLGSSDRLDRAKAAALAAAEKTFCWERQERVLLEGVGRALGRLTV
jgi:glycosyltransferase involved in cell wall biosynthesis